MSITSYLILIIDNEKKNVINVHAHKSQINEKKFKVQM